MMIVYKYGEGAAAKIVAAEIMNNSELATPSGKPDAGRSVLIVVAENAAIGDWDTQTATVVVLDSQGNPVAGVAVDFMVSAGARVLPSTSTSDAAGKAAVRVSANAPGRYAVYAAIGSADVANSPQYAIF